MRAVIRCVIALLTAGAVVVAWQAAASGATAIEYGLIAAL